MNDAPPSQAALGRLRTDIRRRRAALDPETRTAAAESIARRTLPGAIPLRSRHLGLYLAVRGEVDCAPIARRAWRRGLRVYVPVLRGRTLLFAPFEPGCAMRANRFGIPEPLVSPHRLRRPDGLDAVIVPLVAFDHALNRVGMGAGFYDRSFAFRLHRRRWRKPRLIGVAYSFQQVASLRPASWDVPLDVVITEKESFGSR